MGGGCGECSPWAGDCRRVVGNGRHRVLGRRQRRLLGNGSQLEHDHRRRLDSGAVPGSGDNVIFDANGTIANEIGSLGGNQSALSVSFSNNIADNITIASGNTLTVGSGALTANSGHTVTLAGTVGVGSSSATTTSKVQAGELDITGTTTMSTSTGYTAMPLSVGASSGTATLQIDGGSLTLNGYGPNGYTMTVGDTQSTYGAGASAP